MLGLAGGGIVMGRIADRTSTRRVCLAGTIVLGLCILGASRAEALWQFYLLVFLAGFFGGGALFAPLIANVGNWFKSNAGLALGIASAGQALGQGGVPYGIAVLIGAFGWRGALGTMGLVTLIGLTFLALLIRQPPRPTPATTPGTPATDDEGSVVLPANVVVTWLGIAVLFCCICMSVPLVQDRGFPLEDAGSVIFVMLVAAIIGRIAFSKLADMIGAIKAYWIASL